MDNGPPPDPLPPQPPTTTPDRTVSLGNEPPPDLPPPRCKRKSALHRLTPSIQDRLASAIHPLPPPAIPIHPPLNRRRSPDQRRNLTSPFYRNLISLRELTRLCTDRQDWVAATATGLSPDCHLQWHAQQCPSPGCDYLPISSGAERLTNLLKHMHHQGAHTNANGTTVTDPIHQGTLTCLLHSLKSHVPSASIFAVSMLPNRNTMDIGGIPTNLANTEPARFRDNRMQMDHFTHVHKETIDNTPFDPLIDDPNELPAHHPTPFNFEYGDNPHNLSLTVDGTPTTVDFATYEATWAHDGWEISQAHATQPQVSPP